MDDMGAGDFEDMYGEISETADSGGGFTTGGTGIYQLENESSGQTEIFLAAAGMAEPGTEFRQTDADGEDGENDEEADSEPSVFSVSSIVEAVLFAAREPLKPAQIAKAVGKRTRQDAVRAAIDELNVQYLESGRAFEIAEVSGRFQLMSRPEYVEYIKRIYPKRELGEKDKMLRLSPSALDTLAIIAYKQPVTRGEIEHIRGVGCGPVLRALMERGTVKVAGKAQLVGQPWLYGTTEAFLAEFGLGSLDELPLRSEFLSLVGAVTEVEQEIGYEPEAEMEEPGEFDEQPEEPDEDEELEEPGEFDEQLEEPDEDAGEQYVFPDMEESAEKEIVLVRVAESEFIPESELDDGEPPEISDDPDNGDDDRRTL